MAGAVGVEALESGALVDRVKGGEFGIGAGAALRIRQIIAERAPAFDTGAAFGQEIDDPFLVRAGQGELLERSALLQETCN